MSFEAVNLDYILFGQSLKMWLQALGVALGGYVLVRFIRLIVASRLHKLSRIDRDDFYGFLLACLNRINGFLLLIITLYAGLRLLEIPDKANAWFNAVFVIAVIVQCALWANEGISYWFKRYERQTLDDDASRLTTLRAARVVLRLFLTTVVILLALDNIPGVEITALVASLGIGGIAVALALQNILGDLFASLSIVLDKPFVVGEFIIVDNYLGTVENVGLKTTRIRSLSGEQLIFSNNDLLQSRIRNYKRMEERRIVFSLGVVYQTPADKLERIPGIIRGIIESLDQTRFDRAHFAGYGDYALKFEIVYYVLSPDYTVYMDIQQAVNLRIYRSFQDEAIEFAYPTRTLFITPDIGDQ